MACCLNSRQKSNFPKRHTQAWKRIWHLKLEALLVLFTFVYPNKRRVVLLSSVTREPLAPGLSVLHAAVCEMVMRACALRSVQVWARCSAQAPHALPCHSLRIWVLWCAVSWESLDSPPRSRPEKRTVESKAGTWDSVQQSRGTLPKAGE